VSGVQKEIRYSVGLSSIGSILVAASGRAVVAIPIGENPKPDQLVGELQRRHPEARLVRDEHGCGDYVAHVLAFIETPTRDLDLPIKIRGTAFPQRVWQAVRAIPFGRTSSFSGVARKIGRRGPSMRSPMRARTIRSNSPSPATGCSAATAPFPAGPPGLQ